MNKLMEGQLQSLCKIIHLNEIHQNLLKWGREGSWSANKE
jgi:hypothetical protein